MQERAALMLALQQHVELRPGTQAEKAEALGITQPRLNDLLKDRIDKFSLDGLVTLATKAGLRVNVNVQPVQLHSGLGNINPSRGPVLSVFAPAPSELGKLDSKLGTSLFLSLLRCEAIAVGINPKDVVLSLNINTKDGGIDAKVDNSPTSSSLLEKGSTYFQIKTGESFKPWQPGALKKELFGKSNASPSKRLLGNAIRNCLDQNGTYALVTFGHDLLGDAHSQIIEELINLFMDCGYADPKVRVYGQGQMVGELDKYPSICLDLIGMADGGFLSFKGWRCNAQMKLPLELGNEQTRLIKDIQTCLQEDTTQHIRIIGDPGIGKTRLVIESVSIDEIAPSVIYVPTGEEFQKSKLFNELLKPDRHYYATLVIDDCDNRDRASIWSALKGRTGIKLITIDHGPDNTYDSTMKTFICPQLQEEQIKNILLGYLKKNTDLHNWANWCSGSPRVAHAVGENLKSNPEDILKSPADVPIWERYIIGHKEMDSRDADQYRLVLRHIALFHRFGFESPVNDEAHFICRLIQEIDPTITWGRFQMIVQHYRNKRILQGRHTLFIVPKALHIHLWVEFWINHGHGFNFQAFLEKIPASMKRWFLQLFIYAHAAEPAKNVVKTVLSPKGPFSDLSFLKSETGLRFVNYLAEADPASTLSMLERTINTWTHEELYSWTSGRQEIVWALEKIVAWDEFFIRATNILIPLALAENANNSNNSKGLLLSLFSIGMGWAPTEAPPSKRFPILQDLVKSTDASRRALGLELCNRWLETHGGYRIIGAEYQGLKPPIEFWRPNTYGEVFCYWREVICLLRDEMKGFNVTDRNQAANVLVDAASGLIRFKEISNELMGILLEIASDKEINRGSITQFVIWELRQRNEKLDKSTLAKIRQLDQILTGDSLWDRTNRYVIHTNWDEDYMFRGDEYKELETPSKRVRQLAKEYIKDINVFSEHLPKLLRESGHRLPELGMECGKLATPEFDEAISSHIQSDSKAINGIFIGGYMSGVRTQDAARWESQIQQLLNDKDTIEIAIDCIRRSGVTESLLRRMLDLLKEGVLTSKAFDRFILKQDMNDIRDVFFQEIITTLLQHPDNTSVSICTQLVQDYYFKNDSSSEFPEQLIFLVLTAVPQTESQDQMYGYHWHGIAKSFIKSHPNQSIALLSHILNNMGMISHYGTSNYIANIADEIVMASPHESWKIISTFMDSKSKNHYEIRYWLGDTGSEDTPHKGAINYIPAKEIINWIKEDTEQRLWLIQDVLPKTLDQNEGGQLTHLFIEEFCDNNKIANSLFVHFHIGGWSGYESSYLSRKRDLARRWLSEIPSAKIQLWLGKFIDYLSNRIETAQIQEEREF
ncbi:MAG: XRE family transcriptional regulator [Gammaproteobacteria bacterium]|nr:XRE family transcriptional regulator [Gammaproteobacteria bacterium]